jgi:F-type H+-transporting ATPase subunit c
MNADYFHYAGVGLAIALSSLGTGIAQGYASHAVLESMMRQSIGYDVIKRAMMIGLVFIESGAILALVFAFVLLTDTFSVITPAVGYAHLSMGFCIGFVTAIIAIASSFAVAAAAASIARQPFFAQKILSFMMILQMFIEASVIFAFVLLLIINAHIHIALSLADGLKLAIAALGVAVGTVGPAIAQARFGRASALALGLERSAYSRVVSFSLLTEAMIETSVIFILITTLILIFKVLPVNDPFTAVYSLLPATLMIAFGTSAAAIGVSYVASRSCRLIALDDAAATRIFRTSFIAQAFIESCGIYALVVGLLMIFKI